MNIKNNKMKKNNGFTLVEVLITVLIMAVGLLGLAGLQTTALRNNLSAEQRGQAIQLAYDMADRIRSNITDASLYSASKYKTGPAADFGCDISTAPCSPANLAQTDLFQWNNAISTSASGALPGGVGIIDVSGSVFTVTIQWDDNRDGITNASDASVAVRFEP